MTKQTETQDEHDQEEAQIDVKVTTSVTFVYPLKLSTDEAAAIREDKMPPELLSDVLAAHGSARYWLNEDPLEDAEIEVVIS